METRKFKINDYVRWHYPNSTGYGHVIGYSGDEVVVGFDEKQGSIGGGGELNSTEKKMYGEKYRLLCYWGEQYLILISKENSMAEVNGTAKLFLSKQDQELMEAGFLNTELGLTSKCLNAMQLIVFTQYKAELVKLAQAQIKENTK